MSVALQVELRTYRVYIRFSKRKICHTSKQLWGFRCEQNVEISEIPKGSNFFCWATTWNWLYAIHKVMKLKKCFWVVNTSDILRQNKLSKATHTKIVFLFFGGADEKHELFLHAFLIMKIHKKKSSSYKHIHV